MISATSAESADAKAELVPLRDPSFISLLRAFKRVLKTSVGPDGYSKLLVSGGGYVQLSSSSSQIIQHYDQFDSPIIQFIAQIMKGQSDFGLYCGLIVAASLEHLLALQISESISPKQSINIVNILTKNCNDIFASDKLKIRVNFDSVSDFIPLVNTVLGSKCNVFMSNSCLAELCIQIVKSFLFTLDVDNMITGTVLTHVHKGNEEFKFYPGIVYQLTDDDDIWISNVLQRKQEQGNVIKTLLFTTALDYSNKNKEEIIDIERYNKIKIFEMLNKAIELEVDLIACQKTVHSDITLFLQRKSIIILERLGTNLANNLERLSGSFPISDINRLSVNDISSMTGTVDHIKIFDFNNNVYLLMQRHATNIGTLLLKTPCLAGSQQIKILVEQALGALRTLIIDPAVCPGAGCFETCLFFYLQKLCKEEISPRNVKWLFNTLIEASGCSLPICVDTYFHHAWTTEDQLECNCQLISKSSVLENGGTFHLISLNDELFDVDCDPQINHQSIKLTSNAIVDSFVRKRNAVVVSFESCINLLSIGTVVYRKMC